MMKDEKILQLKISLDGIEPQTWRRFLVKDSISFRKLHETIQIVMGWENYHHHEFEINGKILQEEGFNPAEGALRMLTKSSKFQKMLESQDLSKGSASLDVTKLNKILEKEKRNKKDELSVEIPLSKFINKEGMIFNYVYDFGDNWEHSIIVEKIMEKDDQKYPTCTAGERACPPEDCGGVHGYKELMEIRKDKKHPEYKERVVEWLGEDYNPELFVVDWVNVKLHGKRPVSVWVSPEKKLEKQKSCDHDFVHLVNKKDYDVFKCKKCDFVNKIWKE